MFINIIQYFYANFLNAINIFGIPLNYIYLIIIIFFYCYTILLIVYPFIHNSFLFQVKGLSIIEHEKLAVAQRHAAESNTSADAESTGDVTALRGGGGSGGGGSGSVGGSVGSGSVGSGSIGGTIGNGGGGSGVGDVSDMSEAVRNIMKRTPTPAPSPAPEYIVPNMYSTSPYCESPPKRVMR